MCICGSVSEGLLCGGICAYVGHLVSGYCVEVVVHMWVIVWGVIVWR